jgi:hypothetical protein
MQIKIRSIKPEDSNFIISCWVKSSYNGGTGYKERLGVYHKGLDNFIKKKYESGEIDGFVACMEDDEDLILGFAVFGLNYCLHFAYTKEAFKKQGICKQLLNHFYKSKKDITVSFWTKDIKYIQKLYNVTYDRFKFFN